MSPGGWAKRWINCKPYYKQGQNKVITQTELWICYGRCWKRWAGHGQCWDSKEGFCRVGQQLGKTGTAWQRGEELLWKTRELQAVCSVLQKVPAPHLALLSGKPWQEQTGIECHSPPLRLPCSWEAQDTLWHFPCLVTEQPTLVNQGEGLEWQKGWQNKWLKP